MHLICYSWPWITLSVKRKKRIIMYMLLLCSSMHDCFVSTLDTIVWLGAHYLFAIATARAATSPFVFNSIDAIVWLDMRYMSATKHCSVSPPSFLIATTHRSNCLFLRASWMCNYQVRDWLGMSALSLFQQNCSDKDRHIHCCSLLFINCIVSQKW